jgi:hypothetical protein
MLQDRRKESPTQRVRYVPGNENTANGLFESRIFQQSFSRVVK